MSTSTSWLGSSITKPATSRKSKAEPAIVHPLFAQCASLIDDPMWVTLFKKAATGKMPPKFSYINGILMFRRGQKVISTEVPQLPQRALEVCVEFFKSQGGIYSRQDVDRDQREKDQRVGEEITDWSSIKKKYVKQVLLKEFISRITISLNLNQDEECELHDCVFIGFMLGYLDSSMVVMADNKVSSISGINLSTDNLGVRHFSYDPSLVAKKRNVSRSRQKEGETKGPLIKRWAKFLTAYHKEYEKRPKTSPVGEVPAAIVIGEASSVIEEKSEEGSESIQNAP